MVAKSLLAGEEKLFPSLGRKFFLTGEQNNSFIRKTPNTYLGNTQTIDY